MHDSKQCKTSKFQSFAQNAEPKFLLLSISAPRNCLWWNGTLPSSWGSSCIWATEMTINTLWKQKRLNVKVTDGVGKFCFPSIEYYTHPDPFQINGSISENHKSKLDLFCFKTNSWSLGTLSPLFSRFNFMHLPARLLPFKIILYYLIFTVV